MTKRKKTLVFLGAYASVCVFIFTSCGPNVKSIKRYQAMETGVSNPTSIEDLKRAVSAYEERVLDITLANEQIGIWYKLLVTRYVDRQMYGEALEAAQKALQYYPANQNLFYYVGVCAGYMAKASLDFKATGSTSQRDKYLLLSESAYKRAIELESGFERALYGLGVLYCFELNQPAKAIPVLEQLIGSSSNHTDGLFVLARAYYMTYDFERALLIYDRIIKNTPNAQKKSEAEANKKVVLDAIIENQSATPNAKF